MTNDYTAAIADYEDGLPVKEILEKHDLSRQTFYDALRREGIPKRKPRTRRPGPVEWDTTYFETIDNEEKAYWLGFLVADGCVQGSFTGDPHLKTVKVVLNNRDVEHLFAFCRSLGADIGRVKIRQVTTSYGSCTTATLVLTSSKTANDLARHGCIPNKSLVATFPDLPQHLRLAFIAGYLDGNGCITRSSTDGQWGVKFCGAHGVLSGIQETFRELTGRPFRQRIYPCRKAYQLDFGGAHQIEEVLGLLYGGACPHLARKETKYLSFLAERASRAVPSDTPISIAA